MYISWDGTIKGPPKGGGGVIAMDGAMVGLGDQWSPPTPQIFFLILLYIWVLILAICFIKLQFRHFNNIIDSFKSIVIVTNLIFYNIFTNC